MTDLIGLISTSATIAKGLYEITKEYNNSVLLKQISDLTMQLAQVKTEAAELMTELQTLKIEIAERKNNPLHYNGAVYMGNDDHAYCPACYDKDRKYIHLTSTIRSDTSIFYLCHICKAHFIHKN